MIALGRELILREIGYKRAVVGTEGYWGKISVCLIERLLLTDRLPCIRL